MREENNFRLGLRDGLAIGVGYLAVSYLIRLLPMLFARHKIKNRFVRSLLYYVPYTVLAAMTIPTIFFAPDHLISGVIACVVCIALAYFKRGLVTVAVGGALSVLLCELVITYLI